MSYGQNEKETKKLEPTEKYLVLITLQLLLC